MSEHVLKCWDVFFQDVVDELKTFELRRNDRNFGLGDTLRLRETRYATGPYPNDTPAPVHYTGRECVRKITYIILGQAGLQPGFVILGTVPA